MSAPKKKHTLNPIKTPPKLTKTKSLKEKYFFLRIKPYSEAYLDDLATELIEWSTKKDSLTLECFLHEQGITYANLIAWGKKYPKLGDAHKFVVMGLGGRREQGAITKKYDGNFVAKAQPLYSERWIELEEWRAEQKSKNLAKELEAQATVFNINKPKYEVEDEGDNDKT